MATKDLTFCPNCSNMLYYRETSAGDDSIRLIEFCKRCGYERVPSNPDSSDSPADKEIIVYEKNYERGYIQPMIDEVVFGDPAVPTTKEVTCTNTECPSRKGDVEPSAKFIVLNPDTYSILYRCTLCETTWRNKN